MNIVDKLYNRVEKNGMVCLGLDTSLAYLPEGFKKTYEDDGEAIFEFNKRIIDKTLDVVACYKVQIAYYEALGLKGLKAYKDTLAYLRKKDAIIIADIKRGDIAATAKMYAKAHFEGDFESDFITLSPYMGMDSIEPYLEYVKDRNKGLFVLVRTSNKGAEDFEALDLKDGGKLYDNVGERVHILGKEFLGECSYSQIGGVLGCTQREEVKAMRESLNQMFFLIPGYGAQGGTAEDVCEYLKDGNGGVVNSSRKILLAYKERNMEEDFAEASRIEAIAMRDAINAEVKRVKGEN
ncbi:orotidine-5'-phosphate decarboxylase [Clostridium cavendishii DSM 21758]|uniref:Orotidine 5'-phosphate decarboxylase n=1 Tax=Clostridium cavendishii DSM 21758 TaxID=1121302 RepID=A0A1M6F3G1_9CLOT|nr:orotidine-5'-phosphate decarboxylase [Clostridium cavendishii]SHI92274.1 orotidine-5'-phosphate decarboxylase [Clostridium cavendishii DSM 21758]